MQEKEQSLRDELENLQKRAENEPDFYNDRIATRRLPQVNRIIELFDQQHRIEKDIQDSVELNDLLDDEK